MPYVIRPSAWVTSYSESLEMLHSPESFASKPVAAGSFVLCLECLFQWGPGRRPLCGLLLPCALQEVLGLEFPWPAPGPLWDEVSVVCTAPPERLLGTLAPRGSFHMNHFSFLLSVAFMVQVFRARGEAGKEKLFLPF